MTDEVMCWHLRGEDARGRPCLIGIYPMLRDERCWFLAVDFDGEAWADDGLTPFSDPRAVLSQVGRITPAELERRVTEAGGRGWITGWPAEVPLPVDPKWKETHTGSVHRLIRDGVDIPLARLFVDAATAFPSGEPGAERARSASEAFLLRWFESLPDLAGRFKLNAHLPIPFDDLSRMEVDFLCLSARLVIEVDGGQHLGSEDAWRRDRRKDAALQANGYFVLRFLAADLAAWMDFVLDAIRATPALRDRREHGET